MAIPITENLVILQGATFVKLLRWDTGTPVFKAITNIAQVAPVEIAVPAHGVPAGWPVAVVSVKGMVEINIADPKKTRLYTPAEPTDTENVILPFVDASLYSPYDSGGYVRYMAPVDLTGFTARMTIRRTQASTDAEVTLTSQAGDIVLDNVAKTITIIIADTITEALTMRTGVYDLELIAPTNEVFRLMEGAVTVNREITR